MTCEEFMKELDRENRDLFCKCINEFAAGKSQGPRFRIKFIDLIDEQDILAVSFDGGRVSLINTHANSIDSTFFCLASLIHVGNCTGYMGAYYADDIPDWVVSQI